MRRALADDEPSAILNNYGTPSIYNEFAWAFGEDEYDPEKHILELRPGKFADLHLPPSLSAKPFEEVLARRRAIIRAYRESADCSVIVMTLGLVEIWYDSATGYYLNVSPRPSHIREFPGRFTLHVLSFEETYDYLERTALLIRKYNNRDAHIILTVSPVPLIATHRAEDVMVANCYSKSVLRAAAETLIARYDFVTYFPSYESVTISDRERAWLDDLVHVTPEIVAFNVSRMVSAYTGEDADLDSIAKQIEQGNIEGATETARELRTGGAEAAPEFFERFGGLSARSAEFALEHARYEFGAGNHERAQAILDRMPAGQELQADVLRSKILVEQGKGHEAVAVLDPYATPKRKTKDLWYTLLRAAISTNDIGIINGALARLKIATPAHGPRTHIMVAEWHRNGSRLEDAISHYQTAASLDDNPESEARLFLSECLIAAGRRDEARTELELYTPRNAALKVRRDRLVASLD
jgi:hypothetical protein